ncbi:hypothetical protein ACVSUJ_20315 [Yersinia enterocolitica]|uniref:hypothetical protein n=1 Tax=Yersinia enterocolitica TaxID=630 RepID=UPI001C8D0B6D|nr:hypothetical protein [Yersinia enterocolitica]MBX9477039.1 hypothetical protein [Yersinia enterocolitica]
MQLNIQGKESYVSDKGNQLVELDMEACKEISGGFLGALCLGMAMAGGAIIGAGVGMTISG